MILARILGKILVGHEVLHSDTTFADEHGKIISNTVCYVLFVSLVYLIGSQFQLH